MGFWIYDQDGDLFFGGYHLEMTMGLDEDVYQVCQSNGTEETRLEGQNIKLEIVDIGDAPGRKQSDTERRHGTTVYLSSHHITTHPSDPVWQLR